MFTYEELQTILDDIGVESTITQDILSRFQPDNQEYIDEVGDFLEQEMQKLETQLLDVEELYDDASADVADMLQHHTSSDGAI